MSSAYPNHRHRQNSMSNAKHIEQSNAELAETQDSAFLHHLFTQYNEVAADTNFISQLEHDLHEDMYLDQFGEFLDPAELARTPGLTSSISTSTSISNLNGTGNGNGNGSSPEQDEQMLDQNIDYFTLLPDTTNYSGLFSPMFSPMILDASDAPSPSPGPAATPKISTTTSYPLTTSSTSTSGAGAAATLPPKLAFQDPCTPTNRTCMRTATALLKSLHISPSACLCSSSFSSAYVASTFPNPRSSSTSFPHPASSPPTGASTPTGSTRAPRLTDSVLTGNRDAVLVVSRMLQCPCSARPQLQLLLCVVCDKIIRWYRALIRSSAELGCGGGGGAEPRDVPNQNSNSRREMQMPRAVETESAAEKVLHQPITIGLHALEEGLERKIREQVITGELARLERLVEGLAGRIRESRGGKEGRTGTASGRQKCADDMGLNEVIYGRLAAFLQRQLQDARRDMEGVGLGER